MTALVTQEAAGVGSRHHLTYPVLHVRLRIRLLTLFLGNVSCINKSTSNASNIQEGFGIERINQENGEAFFLGCSALDSIIVLIDRTSKIAGLWSIQ